MGMQVHKDIVTFQHNNQPVTTSHEIARVTGIPHDMVLRSIRTMKKYYEELDQLSAFDRDFIVMTDKILNCNDADNSNPRKRGRPSIVYWLTKEGSLSFIGSLTGKKACEFRIAIASAFVRMEQTIKAIIPQLQAENAQLRLENERLTSKPKQIAGPRKGYLRTPHIQINLWGEQDAIIYEMRPKDQLDEKMRALAYIDLYGNMARGLEQKRTLQLEIITRETMKDRAEVQQLANKRFSLPEANELKKQPRKKIK